MALAAIGATAMQVQVDGAWHCGNDYCTCATERSSTDFDNMNHWAVGAGEVHR